MRSLPGKGEKHPQAAVNAADAAGRPRGLRALRLIEIERHDRLTVPPAPLALNEKIISPLDIDLPLWEHGSSMEWPKSLYELPRTLLGFHVAIVRGNHRRLDARKSIEERLARLEVEAAARHLLNHYAYCYDAGDLDGMMDVYSDDCLLINRLGTFKGAEAIRANYERAISERTVSFHHIADIEVYPSEDASEAWVTAYIHNLAVRRGDPGGTMATCVFHMRHGEDGGWKFSESRIAISDQHSFLPRQVKSAERSDGNDTYPDTVAQLIDDLA